MTTADHIAIWLLVGTLPAVNLYPLFYAFRPWRSTPQGRALMMKALGNVIIIDVVLAYVKFGDYPFRDPIRITGFGLFFLGIWYLFVSMLTAPGAMRYPPLRWFRRRGRTSGRRGR